jgi:pimeloyl-ACP methyl ester carboxylesterase
MARAPANGIQLSYEVHGEGEPVLLVCGTGQAAYTWQLFQVSPLTAAGYQVVTFDNRGMPPSDCPPAPYTVQEMAADAAALIEATGMGSCRVAGISLGAFITQELALARPDLVRGAVMMGTMGRQDVFRRAIADAWLEMDGRGIELTPKFEAVMLAFTLFSPGVLCDDDRVQLFLDLTAAAPRWENPGRRGQIEADRAYDGRLEALAGISVPSMVVGFELDMLTPAVRNREVAAAIPGCRYEEIENCAHGGPFERPDEVNKLLLDFFAGV